MIVIMIQRRCGTFPLGKREFKKASYFAAWVSGFIQLLPCYWFCMRFLFSIFGFLSSFCVSVWDFLLSCLVTRFCQLQTLRLNCTSRICVEGSVSILFLWAKHYADGINLRSVRCWSFFMRLFCSNSGLFFVMQLTPKTITYLAQINKLTPERENIVCLCRHWYGWRN